MPASLSPTGAACRPEVAVDHLTGVVDELVQLQCRSAYRERETNAEQPALCFDGAVETSTSRKVEDEAFYQDTVPPSDTKRQLARLPLHGLAHAGLNELARPVRKRRIDLAPLADVLIPVADAHVRPEPSRMHEMLDRPTCAIRCRTSSMRRQTVRCHDARARPRTATSHRPRCQEPSRDRAVGRASHRHPLRHQTLPAAAARGLTVRNELQARAVPRDVYRRTRRHPSASRSGFGTLFDGGSGSRATAWISPLPALSVRSPVRSRRRGFRSRRRQALQ